ncbi:hypothetical protein H4582DRAFT_2106869 [Lactarius indigo]|nr:hypothetical protein H4582DRAFT_2106869 [Lactarius indigo]
MSLFTVFLPNRTLSTIAENCSASPTTQVSPIQATNTIIKRDIVDPKGSLEYAVAVRRNYALLPESRFLPHTLFHRRWGSALRSDQFQPYYTFNDKHHVGSADRCGYPARSAADGGQGRGRGLKVRMAKVEEELRIKRAKEAFMDDRRAQALRTERERKIRSQEGVAQAQSPIPGGHVDDLKPEFD